METLISRWNDQNVRDAAACRLGRNLPINTSKVLPVSLGYCRDERREQARRGR